MVPDHGCAVSWQRHSAGKLGSLIWIEDANQGWACSSYRWRFPVPTLLTGEDAKRAYDRLAAVKFREHKCEAETSLPAMKQETTLNNHLDPLYHMQWRGEGEGRKKTER
jgi:hypothetical protein